MATGNGVIVGTGIGVLATVGVGTGVQVGTGVGVQVGADVAVSSATSVGASIAVGTAGSVHPRTTDRADINPTLTATAYALNRRAFATSPCIRVRLTLDSARAIALPHASTQHARTTDDGAVTLPVGLSV